MNSSNDATPAQDVAGDLAYVRALAEEGRDAPLVGGVYYVIWGGLMSAAALVGYLDAICVVSLGAFDGAAPWLTAGIIGWILSFALGGRTGVKPGALTRGSQTAMAAWFGVGVFMSLLFAAMLIVHDNFTAIGVPPYFLFSMMFPIAFGLYGVAFFATATAANLGWLKIFAGLSFLFAVACLFFAASIHQLLLGALGTFVCALTPGIILMRSEPGEIV